MKLLAKKQPVSQQLCPNPRSKMGEKVGFDPIRCSCSRGAKEGQIIDPGFFIVSILKLDPGRSLGNIGPQPSVPERGGSLLLATSCGFNPRQGWGAEGTGVRVRTSEPGFPDGPTTLRKLHQVSGDGGSHSNAGALTLSPRCPGCAAHDGERRPCGGRGATSPHSRAQTRACGRAGVRACGRAGVRACGRAGVRRGEGSGTAWSDGGGRGSRGGRPRVGLGHAAGQSPVVAAVRGLDPLGRGRRARGRGLHYQGETLLSSDLMIRAS